MSEMTPREIAQELDKHIIGQQPAKRAVAIALRNRWRRMQIEEELRNEITPKYIYKIAYYRVNFSTNIANFGKFRRLYLNKRGVGQMC